MDHAATVDLRSDTVTRPSAAMWEAMRAAPLGDDVLGDEPTVARLEALVASTLGKEAAVFVPSGTMANQLAIRTACGPGDEVIAHEDSHIIHYETGAPAALAGAMVRTVRGEAGQFDAVDVRAAVRTRNVHHPVSRMLVAENTQNRGGGSVWAMPRWEAVAAEGRAHGLHVHVDGARLFNAAVEIARRRADGERGGDLTGQAGTDPRQVAREICASFDSVSMCLSKGLGAPIGSLLLGSKPLIARARRWRKMLGGGMRQAGLLAAAAHHALDHHIDRMALDHQRAKRLAEGLLQANGFATDARVPDLPDKALRRLGEAINRWTITPNGSEGYRKAEVTLGGVDTKALSQQSMMVQKVPGLYFIGEAVDVTGWLGGYNFQWAWASGVAAGLVA